MTREETIAAENKMIDNLFAPLEMARNKKPPGVDYSQIKIEIKTEKPKNEQLTFF